MRNLRSKRKLQESSSPLENTITKEGLMEKNSNTIESENNSPKAKVIESSSLSQKSTKKGHLLTKRNLQVSQSKKNVNLNFIRAVFWFANSHIAIPYLKTLLLKEKQKFTDFTTFLHENKSKINGIHGFLSMVKVEKNDTEKQIALKKIFQALGEIFVKFFSVNWIFHSKVENKQIYLNHRHLFLRRLKNPGEYLEE